MANNLLTRLREKDKRGLFNMSQNFIQYKSGFLPFDFRNGYMLEVMGEDGKTVDAYPSVGIPGGTFTTIIGKTGVAKTTWIIQTAYNIVKKFNDNAFVLHYDLEQAINYTRIRNVTGADREGLEDKYILRQEKNYLEDIFDTIIAIANEKESGKKEFKYDTGLKDEFGNSITAYVPTVVVIDSLPSLASNTMEQEEIKGQTDAMRMSQKVKQFYVKLLPIIKTYNISVFAVNHINAKIEMNAFTKTQPQVMYMKMDEAVPGGNAPMYYAMTLVKFVSAGKKNVEDDGFDGFTVRCELLKSRTNKGGQSCHMVYDQSTGFDPVLTMFQFAIDNDLLDGRNPYKYFKNYKETKFDSRKFREAFHENEDVRKALMFSTEPYLMEMLSHPKDIDRDISNMEVILRLLASQENE